MKTLLRSVSALALATSALAAHADIVTALSAAPTSTGNGFFAYTYNVQLTGGQLDATNGSTTSPTPLQFGTVYDFGTLLKSSGGAVQFATTGLLSSAFAFSFDNVSTPSAYATAPTDDPTRANVRFTYTGTANVAVTGQTTTFTNPTLISDGPANLGTFTVYSPFGTTTTTGNYDGQTYKGSNNTIQGNVGLTAIPNPTPEPSAFAALGLGAAAMLRRRKRA